MLDFIAAQLDYISFIAACALLIAAGECIVLADDSSGREGWFLLAGFLLLRGAALMSGSGVPVFHNPALRSFATTAVNAFSFVFLFAFAMRVSALEAPRSAVRLAPWALAGVYAVVAVVFGDRVLAPLTWLPGAPIAVLAAAALLRKVRARGPGWLALAAFTVCLALIGLLAAAVGAAGIFRPQWNPLILQLIAILLAIGLGVTLPLHDLAVMRAGMKGLRNQVSPALTAVMLGGFPVLLALGWGLTDFLDRQGRTLLLEEADAQAQVYTATISAHTLDVDQIAQMMAGSPAVGPFLASHGASLRAEVESDLDWHSGVIPSAVGYILDAEGTVVFSSNRREKDSFVGRDFSSRPYVADALAGLPGRAFAVGLTTGLRGYYASAPVLGKDGRVLGAAAIEQRIEHIESNLGGSALYFLVDPNGIVFMSSRPELRLRVLWPLAATARHSLEIARQFGPVTLNPILAREPRDGEATGLQEAGYLVARQFILPPGWSFVLLTPLRPVMLYRLAGVLATLIVSLVVLSFSVVGKTNRLSSARIVQSQRRYRGLVETLPDWVSIVDTGGVCLFINSAGLRALGRSESDVAGRKIEQTHGVEQARLIGKAMPEAYTTGGAFFETVFAGTDGERRTWSFTVVPLAESAQRGEVMLIGADVTDSRAATERLVRAERMAALGGLAAGVAHQFNNINTVALGNLEMLQETFATIPDRSRQYLAAAREAIDRAVGITSRLLALSGAPRAEGETCRIAEAAGSIAKTLEHELEAEGISLTLVLSDHLPVTLERRHIDFIIRELVSNARHALLEQVRREIRIESGQTGERVYLRVSDTGIGIPREDLRGIFTPFHSRKGEHAPQGSPQVKVRGVGLSLALADSIVKGRGGTIEVESRPGEGSVFTVWLPCAPEKS